MNSHFRLLLLFLGAALLCAACEDKGATPLPYEQESILLPIAQEIAVPAHRDFRDATIDLRDGCEAFVNAPDSQGLLGLRERLIAAHLAWKACEPFEFGQAQNTYLHNRIGKWPSNYNFIELSIGGNEAISASSVEALGSTSRGLSAIEYLLFDRDLSATQQAYVSDSFASRRGLFLQELCRNLQEKADALYEFWQPDGTNFGEQWAQSSETGIQSALNLFVNRQIELVEEVTKSKVGTPLGKFDGGAPQPEAVEAARSENSLALLRKNLETVRAICQGTAVENGLYAALNAYEAQHNGIPLAQAFENTFQDLFLSIDGLPGSLSAVLNSNPSSVAPLYEACRKLTVLFKTDMVSILSITVTVSDNDGD